MKILPMGAALFHAGGRTDGQRNRETEMEKITAGFLNFGNHLGTRIAGVLTIFKHATS